jgi:uncharacterized protein involved in exopolysaccharide biosynthesis/Mrp family chromosome partitioning ATPase
MNQVLPRAILLDHASAPPPLPSPIEDSGFGFADLMSVLLSQRLFMLCILVVTMIGGAIYIYQQPAVYYTAAQISLGANQNTDVGRGANAPGLATTPDNALVQSEMEILRSNDLMIRLINKLGAQSIAEKLRFGSPASFAGAKPDSAKMRDLVQALQARLRIQREQTSNVLSVGFTSPSPDMSVLLANLLIDTYLDSKVDERLAAAQRASAWLNRRVEELAKEVERKEAAVAAYRGDMKLLSVDGATLDEQQYFKLQGEVVTARADLASRQARLSQVQQIAASGGSAEAVSEAVGSPTIQALRQREAEIAGREADLKQRYFPNHPSVQQVAREHDEVKLQINAEIKRIQTTLSNDVDVARTRLRELEAGLAQLEGSLVQGNRAVVRLKELERDAETSSAIYRDFMMRSREIAEQESLKVVDARSVSKAIAPPRPSSTSPFVWLGFFFAAGVFLAVLGGILRSIINDRIIRPETIARRIGTPALVSVPLINQRQLRKLPPDERTPEDFLVNKPMTAFAESLRVLGANLIADAAGAPGLSVAVTSAVASEGKTTLSLSLGRAAAMSGLRVLIIDCDARRPSLSAGIGDRPAMSLADVIKGNANWKEAAVLDPLTSALVLPINARTGEMQSLFRPEAVRKLLSDVRSDFDLIVMDCPPVLAVAETRWLTLVADTTIVVTRWNRTRSSVVRTATREILRAKGRVSGVVLNRIDVGMTKRFSFSDSLYYGSAGKGYYTN